MLVSSLGGAVLTVMIDYKLDKEVYTGSHKM